MIDTIKKYFPDLSPRQISAFETMMKLYPEWNDKINVISRKDIQNLETAHILHSLALAKYLKFSPGSTIMDFGTGGGFPGLPLSVMFPDCKFHLVDRTAKKLKVASEIARESGLDNVSFQHGDVAECKEKFDFVVSRAVMPQGDLLKICRKNISDENKNALPNGLISLKGGDLNEELKSLKNITETLDIDTYFDEDFFKGKKIVYTPLLK